VSPTDFSVGIELEARPLKRSKTRLQDALQALQNAFPDNDFRLRVCKSLTPPRWWGLESEQFGQVEFQTPPMLVTELAMITPVLRFLRTRYEVGRTSGMHVHIHALETGIFDLGRFHDMVVKRWRDELWPSRRTYSKVRRQKPHSYTRDKHYAVNVVWPTRTALKQPTKIHVEVRIFNGTLHAREVKTRVRHVLEMLCCCQV